MNYGVREGEMLAIVKECKHWHHYLEGSMYLVCVVIDYCNLQTFLIGKTLFHKKTRWWEKLSDLNLVIEYCPSRKNAADESSRCSDYIASNNDLEQTHHTVG